CRLYLCSTPLPHRCRPLPLGCHCRQLTRSRLPCTAPPSSTTLGVPSEPCSWRLKRSAIVPLLAPWLGPVASSALSPARLRLHCGLLDQHSRYQAVGRHPPIRAIAQLPLHHSRFRTRLPFLLLLPHLRQSVARWQKTTPAERGQHRHSGS